MREPGFNWKVMGGCLSAFSQRSALSNLSCVKRCCQLLWAEELAGSNRKLVGGQVQGDCRSARMQWQLVPGVRGEEGVDGYGRLLEVVLTGLVMDWTRGMCRKEMPRKPPSFLVWVLQAGETRGEDLGRRTYWMDFNWGHAFIGDAQGDVQIGGGWGGRNWLEEFAAQK